MNIEAVKIAKNTCKMCPTDRIITNLKHYKAVLVTAFSNNRLNRLPDYKKNIFYCNHPIKN